MEKREAKNSAMLDDWEEFTLTRLCWLRGIYSIDLDDQDYKETLKKCEEKIGKTCGSDCAVQKKSSD